jgi:hypothetical protein
MLNFFKPTLTTGSHKLLALYGVYLSIKRKTTQAPTTQISTASSQPYRWLEFGWTDDLSHTPLTFRAMKNIFPVIFIRPWDPQLDQNDLVLTQLVQGCC